MNKDNVSNIMNCLLIIVISMLAIGHCQWFKLYNLKSKLNDNNPDIRREAVVELGRLHDSKAIKSFINALNDNDQHARSAAAEALRKIKEKSNKFADRIGRKLTVPPPADAFTLVETFCV